MAGLNFNITANNQDFMRKLQEVDRGVSQTSKSIESSGQSIESFFRRMTAGAAALAAGFSARELVSNIVQTRGEMQQLEVAFTTMLQSGEKAASLLADAVDFAAKTPFDLQGVAGGIRQLLAYGTAAEDAIADVEMLGNVSAGLSVPLNDMIYLYGTLRAQGRAMTVDIRQFAGRGVPIYEELAKVLGVTRQEVSALITEGKVGFPEVEQAFKNMTSEGGMFYNLMREQSKTITGQISNLQDSISQMFNAIGQQSEGVITSAISGLSWMVEHYQEIGRVLGNIVAIYGSYRAALIAVAASQKLVVASGTIKAFLSLARSITSAKDAMLLLNMAFRANPIGLAVSGITALVTVLLTMRRRSREAAEEVDGIRQAIANETAEVNRLTSSLSDSNTSEDERREILGKLRELAPDVVRGIDDENLSLQELNTNLQEYNELRRAEASVKGFASEIGLDDAAESLSSARERMERERTEIVSVWTDISENISRIRFENDGLPDSLEEFFDKLYDESLGIEDRVNMIRRYYNTLSTSFKVSGVKSDDLTFITEALWGINFKDYDKALSNLSKAEMSYAEDKEKVQQRIEATATAMTDDLERQQEIIDSLNKALFPDDYQSSEAVAGKVDGDGILAVDFDTQVREAKARIDDIKKSLEDLRAGIIPKDSENDAAFSFAAAIEEQEKALKEAQSEYNTLIGYDSKKAERDADALLKVREEAEKAECDLARKGVNDRIALLEMEKERELSLIQQRIDAASSDDEKSSLQRLYTATSGIYDADIKAERDRQSKEFNEYLQKLLGETATYQQARLSLEKQYSEKRKSMYADEKMTQFRDGFTQENRDELDRQERDALDELDMTYAMKSEQFQEWTKVVSEMGLVELRKMLAEAKAVLARFSSSDSSESQDTSDGLDEYSQKAAEASAAVMVLTDAIDGYEQKQEDAGDDTERSSANWTELLGVLRAASDTFSQLGDSIGGTAGELLSSIGSLSSAALSMASGIQAAASATSALEKASAILAVISAAVQVVSFFTSAAKESEEANLAAARATMEYTNALEKLADAKKLAASETVFGTDELGQLNAYSKQLELAKNEFLETYDALTDLGYMSDRVFDNDAFNLLKAGVDPDDGSKLISDLRSGWQKFWGTGDDNVFSFDLSGIIDEAGNIDSDRIEELRAWYEQYGEGMNEQHRIMVDNMLSDWDRYQEALEGIRDFAQGLFGDVASDVADAVLSGSGNLEAEMDEILSDINKKVAKAMIENAIMTEVFNEELSEQIVQALANGDVALANQLFGQGMDAIREMIPELNEFAANAGVLGSESKSTTDNTVMSGVTQESFDMNSGRVANIQTHVISIDKSILSIASDSSAAVSLLTDISSDTSRLHAIERAVSKSMSLISEILLKGIKVN